jgi:hypothetical protein
MRLFQSLHNQVTKLSNLPYMESITSFLKVTNVSITDRGYLVRTDKIESNTILIDYLTRFPLFSSKHLYYLAYREAFFLTRNLVPVTNLSFHLAD